MADILPPAPVDAPFTSYNWADWYKKVRDAINQGTTVVWTAITGTPTTVAGYGITDAPTLNGTNRITVGSDTTDDVIIDTSSKGLVLKDNAGTPHYWRVTVNTTGSLIVTDLGTTKP